MIINSHLREESLNSLGTRMQIVKYINAANITIEFQDKYNHRVNTTYSNFKRGSITNPYDRSVYDVGYVGVGKFTTSIDKKDTRVYNTWRCMIQRCYSDKNRGRHIAYEDCTVCSEWYNFQVFGQWYEENYYEVEGHRMHIDKDLLVKDNKMYSPETCIFLPQRINMLFMNKTKTRDLDLPSVIYRCSKGFQASYNGKSLGAFETLEEAIEKRDTIKRLHIKDVAEEYRERIPPKVFDVLIKW